MGKNYYLGVDIGTYESKGMLINQEGECVQTAQVAHIMESPKPGYAEHDAQGVWWGDLCKITNTIISSAGIRPEEIKGVGVSAIGPCLLPVDEHCNPLRKAILYGVDVRANEEIDYLNQALGVEYVLKKYGNPITSQSIGPKILWLKKHEPEVYHRAAKFVTSSTYLVAKLTGKYYIDHYTAAYFTPMYDLKNCDWDYDNISMFCRADQLATCAWTDELAGGVTKEAAAETGLYPGTPVTVGTADASADAVGIGVTKPGEMLLMFGSSVFIIHVVPKLTVDPRFWAGPYLFKDTYMVASGMSTTGTLTRWFRDNFAKDLTEKENAGGKNAYEALMEEMNHIPPGSDGLVVLPYFSGERTPINDPKAQGMIFGCNLHHTRGHIYQACLEGAAYGIAQHFAGYEEIGMQTKKVVAVGGGTKNGKWMQIVSDVCGKKLYVGEVFGAAYGDALLAALGTGHFQSMDEIAKRIRFRAEVTPNANNTQKYRKYQDIYTKLYQQNKELMHQL